MKLLSKENAKAVPPSREIGSSSCCRNAIGTQKRPDRILRRINCRCLLRIVTGKKVGPLNILTMIWKWPFQKMLSHSILTNWIFYRRSSGPKNQWQNNVSFSVCVFLGAIICARSTTLDALALEPIGGLIKPRGSCDNRDTTISMPQIVVINTAQQLRRREKCAGIMMTASAREIKTLAWFVKTFTTIGSVLVLVCNVESELLIEIFKES